MCNELNLLTIFSQSNSYDHYTAFYLLLLERVKNKENTGTQQVITPKHPSLESQRRRPSSIAEQAMRKLGLSSHQRYVKSHIYSRKAHLLTGVISVQKSLLEHKASHSEKLFQKFF